MSEAKSMSTSNEVAMRLALEAFIAAGFGNSTDFSLQIKAYDLAVEALAQSQSDVKQEQRSDSEQISTECVSVSVGEPVASDAYDKIDRFLRNNLGDVDYAEYSNALDSIYTTPQQRTWVGLTDEEIEKELGVLLEGSADAFVRIIEAKLKEKNGIAPYVPEGRQGGDK